MSSHRLLIPLCASTLAALACQTVFGPAPTPTPVLTVPEAGPASATPVEPPPDEAGPTAVPTTVPAADTDDSALGAVFDDPSGFFSLAYPAGWSVEPYETRTALYANPARTVGVEASIQIKAVSAEALTADFIAFFEDTLDAFEVMNTEPFTLDGYPATWTEMRYAEGGVPHIGLMAAAVRHRVGLLLFAYVPEVEYGDQAGTLRAIVDSARLHAFDELPPYEAWLTTSSAHITFHYLPGTYAAEAIDALADEHETAFAYNAGWLGLDYTGPPVEFFIYPSEELLYLATARNAGFALNRAGPDAAEVHSVWVSATRHQSIGHELTHVVTYWTLGEAGQALLGEGAAVCLDHGEVPVHARASELRGQAALLPLADMLGETWFEHDPAIAYPESGSLACWLLERYGPEKFQALYPRADFETALDAIYGFDLEYLEKDWLTMLDHA
jgi:hypothetical protein